MSPRQLISLREEQEEEEEDVRTEVGGGLVEMRNAYYIVVHALIGISGIVDYGGNLNGVRNL